MTIRARAAAFLSQTDLLRALTAHGSAHLVGSYMTDLMAYPDLDFYMDNAALTTDAYHALFCDLLSLLRPIRCEGFLDTDNATAFIGMETLHNGERWNIDIWWKPAAAIAAAQNAAHHLLVRMDAQPELKTAVLSIKQELCALHLYGLDKGKRHVHSQEIYDAVFEEGIRTAEEFLRKHPL